MRERSPIDATKSPTKRRYFSYLDLEEYEGAVGMWRIVVGPMARKGHVEAASDLMANPAMFADAMRIALQKWPNSCLNAFTTEGNNQRAWLGHAGCYLKVGSPEETTRLAWHTLDDAEQWAANDAADRVIAEWRRAHATRTTQGELFDA